MTTQTINSPRAEASRVRGASYALLMLLAFYMASVLVPSGMITYVLNVPALLIIAMTTIARINDISANLTGPLWNLRRAGLVLVGMYALTQLMAPFAGVQDWPTWRTLIGTWGFAAVWITTPHLPPWWVYIWQAYHVDEYVHPQRRRTDDMDANP